jgi:hypothetical protein
MTIELNQSKCVAIQNIYRSVIVLPYIDNKEGKVKYFDLNPHCLAKVPYEMGIKLARQHPKRIKILDKSNEFIPDLTNLNSFEVKKQTLKSNSTPKNDIEDNIKSAIQLELKKLLEQYDLVPKKQTNEIVDSGSVEEKIDSGSVEEKTYDKKNKK